MPFNCNELFQYKNRYKLGLLLIVSIILWDRSLFSAEWVTATIKAQSGVLHQDHDSASKVLGRYPAGTRVRVSNPPQNGFHAIYFAKPWMGLHYVWISENEIELSVGKIVERTPSSASTISSESDSNNKISPQKWTLTPSMGYTSINYSQEEVNDYSGSLLSVKGELNYRLSPAWEMGAAVSYAALPLSSSRSDITVNFFESHLYLGFSPVLTPSFQLDLLMGGRLSSMRVTQDAFGYPMLIYPEIYPAFKFIFSRTSTLSLTLRYVPLGPIADSNQRVMAFDLSYSFHPLVIMADYSNLSFNPEGGGSPRFRSTSFSLGYQF